MSGFGAEEGVVEWVPAELWRGPGEHTLAPGFLRPMARWTARHDDAEVGVLVHRDGLFALSCARCPDGSLRHVFPSSQLASAPGARPAAVVAALAPALDAGSGTVDLRLSPHLEPAMTAALAQSRGPLRVASWERSYYLDLEDDEEELLAAMSRQARQNVARAREAGVTVRLEPASGPALERFLALYRPTLDRLGARPFERFDAELVGAVATAFGDGARMAVAERPGGAAVAAALLLPAAGGHDAWLAASDPAAWSLRPNNALFFDTALLLRRRGSRRLVLGGGGGAPGLERFKRGLTDRSVPCRRLYRPAAVAARAAGATA